MEQNKIDNKNFAKIIFVNVACLTALSMVHPVTPKLLDTVGLPTFYFGLLYGCLNISTFIASPTFGIVCGLIGRKLPMIIGLLGYAFGQIIFGFFPNTISVLVARIISGTFISAYQVASIAYLSSITPPSKKLKRFAFLNASGSLGVTIGSLLGGYLGRNDYRITFLVQIILLFVCIVLIKIFFEDSSQRDKVNKFSFKIFSFKDFNKVTKSNKFAILILVSTIITFLGIQSYTSTISYYVEKILHLPTTINGLILGSTGFFTIITNLLIIPVAIKKLSSRVLYLISTLTAGLSILIAMNSKNPIFSVIFLLIFIIVQTLITPIMQSMVIEKSKNNQIEILGLQNGFKAIGSFFGAILSGLIFDIWFKLPFIICGTSLIVCFIIILISEKNKSYNKQL